MEDGGAGGGNWDGLPPEVLDMILQHLPVSDLVSCSIISKNWKKAARDVLKRNRECYAHVKDFDEDIQDLNEMIATTDIMEMINGLHIRNENSPEEKLGGGSWENYTRCSDVERFLQSDEVGRRLDEGKQQILGVLCGQWRYLDLDMGFGRRHVVSLDTGLLLREIVLATSDSLQKLVIQDEKDWKLIPCCAKPFPKLKVIQAQDLGYCVHYSLSNFAPNLEKITGAMIELHMGWLWDKFELERMKSIRVVPYFAVPQGEAKEIFGCVSGLHRLDLQFYRCTLFDRDQDLPSWRSFVFPFVFRSLDTLQELCICTLDLFELSMASNGLKFPNLRRLSLTTHLNVTRTKEISILKILNLPNLCPKLEQVEIARKLCIRDAEQGVIQVQESNALDQSNLPMEIVFNCLYNHEYLTFLSTIYPNIRKLKMIKIWSGDDYDVSKVFWDLQSLEYLEICVPDQHDIQFHIEAFLSGINIEEAQLPLLKSQKKKDKLNLCIVPIRASLLNAKNLKELKITVDTAWKTKSWVTEVTENLPERHVRNLKLTFDTNKRLWHRLVRMRALTWLRAKEIKA